MGKKNDFWLDDPEWEMLRRKAENKSISKKLKQRAAAQKPQARIQREEPRATVNREDTEKEVVVNVKLAIPKVKLPEFGRLFKTHKRTILKTATALLVVVGIFGAFKLISARRAAEEPREPGTPQEEAATAFTPLVPLTDLTDGAGKKSEPQYKFDKEKNVLAYVVEFNNAKLTVSQQTLPEQLKTNPGQLEGIASSIKADARTVIETQKGPAHLTTDEELKMQTVVFATEELLVFMQSSKILDEDGWKFYINQLNPSR